jgi:acetylornithine deacetylase
VNEPRSEALPDGDPTRDATTDAIVDELRHLVAFAPVTDGPNRDLIDDARARLADAGARCHLTWDDTGERGNLFASFGPTDQPGVVLSGHTDVVSTEGQEWSADPFALRERAGTLIGRGATDMLGFLAVPLAMREAIGARPLRRPLHLAMSYDEEIGCVGVRRLIAELDDYAARPLGCIVGEPTQMGVVTGHKGKRVLRCRVRGRAGHSSRPEDGVNAIERAAALIVEARRVARRLLDEGPFSKRFDPPNTTMITGTIAGGVAINIVPEDCVFDLEIRNLPEHDPDALIDELKAYARERLEPEMRGVDPDAGFVWEETVRYPGLSTPEEAEVVRLAQRLTGAELAPCVGFGTEGGLFARAGVPSVVCGPGDLAQAHRPDEHVEIAQLTRTRVMVERLLDELCAD